MWQDKVWGGGTPIQSWRGYPHPVLIWGGTPVQSSLPPPPPPPNGQMGSPPPPGMWTDRHLWKQFLSPFLRNADGNKGTRMAKFIFRIGCHETWPSQALWFSVVPAHEQNDLSSRYFKNSKLRQISMIPKPKCVSGHSEHFVQIWFYKFLNQTVQDILKNDFFCPNFFLTKTKFQKLSDFYSTLMFFQKFQALHQNLSVYQNICFHLYLSSELDIFPSS